MVLTINRGPEEDASWKKPVVKNPVTLSSMFFSIYTRKEKYTRNTRTTFLKVAIACRLKADED
jgi:hypothetical protein